MSVSGREGLAPSPWILAWAPLFKAGGRVLDLACGSGRHVRWLAAQGFNVMAVDRDAEALRELATLSRVQCCVRDIEAEPWPFPGETFDAIVVTNYLHRPLLPILVRSLCRRGVLLYETFAQGNGRFGRPANPDFLLQPGELLRAVDDALHVVSYEDRFVAAPQAAMVQRICAVRAADANEVWS